MSAKDILRSLVPSAVLAWNRRRKKSQVLKALMNKKDSGETWTKERLVDSLRAAGCKRGQIY